MKKVYGYARISKDEDKSNYGSIETQKNIINEYATENGWRVEKIFIDDDISGYITIEDRPAFNELYELVNNSKHKPIVLMKDWSRLSRNNGIAQSILTKWKQDEVELILVKEMGAPFNILTDNDDIVGITTWINERYVKETSRKVRDALHDRLKKGVYIPGPRYGYIKGPNGTLTVNEEVREAVQTVFNLYEEGYGTTAIAKKFNIEYDFKNPSIVEAERFKRDNKDHRDIRRSVREYWETDMINKITYGSIRDMLDNSPIPPKLIASDENNSLIVIADNQISNHAIVPSIVLDTKMYEPSRIMRSIQYLIDNNVIRTWNDSLC